MSHEKCPCCDGWGKREVYKLMSTSATPDIVDCTACDGKGYICPVCCLNNIVQIGVTDA